MGNQNTANGKLPICYVGEQNTSNKDRSWDIKIGQRIIQLLWKPKIQLKWRGFSCYGRTKYIKMGIKSVAMG